MKKIFLSIVAALTVSLSAQAIGPVHKLFPVKQADGTTVMLYKNGHDHLAFYTTEDNQVVVRNSDGMLCYAQLDGQQLVASTMVCHNLAERTADELAFVASNSLTPSAAACQSAKVSPYAAASGPRKAAAASTTDGLGKYGTSATGTVSSLGKITLPVIMVQYADLSFHDGMTVEKLQRFFNEEGYHEDDDQQVGSVKDYFLSQSRGLFDPTFDVVDMVTVSKGYAYYGANDYLGNDANVQELVKEAIKLAAADGVDFSKYVDSKTNAVPNVIIYYAGCGEPTGGVEETIWPHYAQLTSSYISGTRFKSYFVGNERYGTDSSEMVMGMGVFVHEFSHALGLPDFYATDYSYSGDQPFGEWSVMDGGPYVGDTYAPTGYNAYERSYMGWLNIPELTEAQTVTLNGAADEDGTMAVLLRNPNDASEYIIFENRQPGTWYSSKDGSGLMVYHIAYNAVAWSYNIVNNTQTRKRAHMVLAGRDKMVYSTTETTDLFGNGVNSILTHTLYGPTTLSGYPIYKILQPGDGTITFNFMDRDLAAEPLAADGTRYEKVTDVSKLAANDEIIFVNEADKVAMATVEQSVGLAAVNVKVADGVAEGNAGVSRYKVRTTTSGTYRFYDESQKAYLRGGTKGLDLFSNTTTSTAATVEITDGNAVITFKGSSSYKLMGYSTDNFNFITAAETPAPIQIYRRADSSSAIQGLTASDAAAASKAVYSLSGQYMGKSLQGLAKGIYVQGGKKLVVK